MTAFGHIIVGTLICHHGQPPRARKLKIRSLLLIGILGALPDIDVLWRPFFQRGDLFFHRGITHSLGFAFLIGLIFLLLKRLRSSAKDDLLSLPALNLFVMVFISVWSHGIIDSFTSGGPKVFIFYPISSEGIRSPWPFIPVAEIPFSRGPNIDERKMEILGDQSFVNYLPRMFEQHVDDPSLFRTFYNFGVMVTELLILLPWLLFVIYRRKARPWAN